MSARFTIDGSDELEARLTQMCATVADHVLRIIPTGQLEALVLGGGYGRGEGGVLQGGTSEEPYNDLEFYILLKGSDLISSRRFGRAIHEAAEKLSTQHRIEIEFKLLSLAKLRGSSVSMFYYDLINGHRVVQGTDDWLRVCEHHRAAHRIPLHEATRLLMNRCSGLLFSQERLARAKFSSDDSDFVGRNLAKAKLAFGDVALTMRGQYHWSCRERHKRLRKLAAETGDENLASLLLLHEQGVDFKLRPIRTEKAAADLQPELEFLKELGRDLWLHLENRRLNTPFRLVEEYSFHPDTKCPESTPFKNRLINFRTFGLRGLTCSRYPRERLLRTLPLLLWSDLNAHLPFFGTQLQTNAQTLSDMTAAYEKVWRIYN